MQASEGFIVTFSVTSRQQLEEAEKYVQQIVKCRGFLKQLTYFINKGKNLGEIPILLVGTKCDNLKREVPSSEAIDVLLRLVCEST